MELSHFDLNLLRALDILLAERNVTHAAERLCVTQQAASSTLQRLRRHFDDELLIRVGRNLELTPLAQSLIVPVREALLAVQSALDSRPRFDPNTAKYLCRIAMSDYCLHVILPHLLRSLSIAAPHIQFQVEALSPASFARLEMGELDFCLTAHDLRLYGTHLPSVHIRSMPLFHDDFVCVADPQHVDISNGITLQTYRKARHNTVNFGEGLRTIVENAWAATKTHFDIAVMVPNFAAQIFMLPGTPLIATSQRRLARTLAPRLGLAVAECPLKLPHLQEILFWHERSEQYPARIFLREALGKVASDLENNRLSNYK
ncbi:LysR family transcriptional regulator [Sphingobium fluviale]|uniref:LysR family transcriptional regulator n=1 Tax=Sphingobium fluviale TaxID=2506423 RepID=UPI0013E97D0D|nr:LysR family transcriptional regulator [Sphingobium fluviale]